MNKAVVKNGRPPVVTPDVVAKLEEAFSWGATDAQASIHAGIHRSTLDRYCKANPDFSNRKEDLKQNIGLIAKKRIFEDIEDKKSQTAISSAKWAVEHTEGRSKQQLHIQQDINFTIVRKEFKAITDVTPAPVTIDSVVEVEIDDKPNAISSIDHEIVDVDEIVDEIQDEIQDGIVDEDIAEEIAPDTKVCTNE